VFLGGLALLVGIIGIFLPLLPTTPFLILAAICFQTGSEKFHTWLMNHKIFGPPILDWQKRKVIRTKYKILATSMMALSGVMIVIREIIPLWLKVAYFVFTAFMLTYIWKQKGE
jgi:uncharacterized membrane protein YbaN (DUF454 family)